MERRPKRAKVAYRLLDESDSDDDFTPVVKKAKRSTKENRKRDAKVECSRQLRSEEDRFQRELEMALVESRHDAMAGLVLTNPVVESENVEPEVQILEEDGREMNTSHEDNGMSVSGEDVSVLPSSVKAVNTSLPDTTPVLSLTTSVASHPDSGHGGTNSVPRVPVKNESQTKDRVAARDVSNTNKNTLTPPSLSTATKPYPSTRVTGKSAASSNAAMPRFGLQSNTANKSATSPTIRLGLSRNARVPPLHPRPLIRTQNLT